MGTKILEWLRALTLGVLIVLGCLHFKAILISALAIDLTKFSATQLISYEWIVPFVSFSALLGRRRELRIAAKLPSWAGLFLTCFFLTALSIAAQSGKPPFQLLCIAGLIYSVGYAFWGVDVAELLRFPMSFLIFAVPVSFYLTWVENLSPPLVEGMTRAGDSFDLFGVASLCDVLNLKDFKLEPASASRGIHTLFGLAAITVAFAHFTVRTRLQRWTLYVCGIPIALLATLFRSFLICLIAALFDRAWATSFYLHFSQYVTFFVGLVLIFMFANLIIKISDRLRKPTAKEWMQSLKDDEAALGRPPQSILKSLTIVFLVLAFACAAFFFAKGTEPSEDAPKKEKPTVRGGAVGSNQ